MLAGGRELQPAGYVVCLDLVLVPLLAAADPHAEPRDRPSSCRAPTAPAGVGRGGGDSGLAPGAVSGGGSGRGRRGRGPQSARVERLKTQGFRLAARRLNGDACAASEHCHRPRRGAPAGRQAPLPLARIVIAAEVAVLAKAHLDRLKPSERKRLLMLLRDARGIPKNLTGRDRREFEKLVAKLEPSIFASTAAEKFSPLGGLSRRS